MNLAAALAKALSDARVTDVFALMGNGNLRMTHHLVVDYKIRAHHARHEAAAVGGADGYARATGKVGVATVTQGPGFTNAITALITAHRARTPLVLLTSDSSKAAASLHPFAATQALDPELLLGPIGIVTMRATTDNGYSSVAEALDYAITHQAVVVVITAAGDDGKHFTGELSRRLPSPRAAENPASGATADEPVRKAAYALLHAERPVILAGRGAVRANAGAAIEALAEASGAALATSIKAAGMFDGNAANIGISGGFSGEAAADVLTTTDCVLVFGASLNYFTTLRNTFFGAATIIQCDNDPSAFGRFARSDIEIPLDAAQAAKEILAQVRQHGVVERPGAPARRSAEAEADASSEDAIDPRALCRTLDRLLPADRTLVVDAGHFTAFPIMYTTINRSNGLVWPIDFGAVGSSIGVAIGAAIGRADRTTVLFIGDGGFFMTLGDFDLVVRERLPLIVVCMNDRAYGSELVHFEEAGLAGTEAIFETPDLSAIAGAVGFQARPISKTNELGPAIAAWRASEGPLFLDCSIRRDVRSPIYAHI